MKSKSIEKPTSVRTEQQCRRLLFHQRPWQAGKTPGSEKFFYPGVKMDWHKDQPPSKRRANALKAHKGDKLATARALQELANVTTDSATARAAKADADYFFAEHK